MCVFVCVALPSMQCACAVLYCLLLLYNIFPHYVITGTIFEEKFIAHKMCSFIFFTVFFYLKHFPLKEELSEL